MLYFVFLNYHWLGYPGVSWLLLPRELCICLKGEGHVYPREGISIAAVSLRCGLFFSFHLSRAEAGLQHLSKYPAHPTQTGWGKLDGRGGRRVGRSFDSLLKSIAQRRKAFTRETRLGCPERHFAACPPAVVVGAAPEFLLYTLYHWAYCRMGGGQIHTFFFLCELSVLMILNRDLVSLST